MNPHPIMSDLLADDLLLDRLGRRTEVAGDPVVPLLAALARHADLPLRGACAPRRFVKRRALTALTAFVVGASGVGVAAALSGPDRPWPRQVHRVADPDGSVRAVPAAPGGVVRGVPRTQGTGSATSGYALVEEATRRIALAPPRVVVTLVPSSAVGEPPAFVASAAGTEHRAGASGDSGRDLVDRPTRAAHAGSHQTAEPSLAADDPKAGGKPMQQAGDAGSTPIMTLAGVASQPAPGHSGSADDAPAQRGKPRPDDGDATSDDPSRQGSDNTPSDRPAIPPSPPAEPAGPSPARAPARPDPRLERRAAPRPTGLRVTADVTHRPAAGPLALPEVVAGAAVTGATTAPLPIVEVTPVG